ncbi:hypothetical protein [Salmonella phage SSBI34]|nr:hypothetical protein [Salmonella phage SSBI34]
MCETCKEGEYPHYGVGPHICFYKIPGAVIGQSIVLHEKPDNFVEDPEHHGLGVWYCPECKAGMAAQEAL